MDRYAFCFLIFCGWFVVFRMFPARIGVSPLKNEGGICGNTDYEETATWSYPDGKLAFNKHCASCHNPALDKKLTGPALLGVRSRIPEGDWIYDWIHDSAKMIQEGDEYAVKIWTENDKVTMTRFPELTHQEIDEIMAFIDSYAPVQF
jgi:cytochrome c2